MGSGLEVVSHATGPWLVRAGRESFAVPAVLGRALLPWQGRDLAPGEWALIASPPGTDPLHWSQFLNRLATALDGGGRPGRLPPPVWLRVPLVPSRTVRFLAGHLQVLGGGRGLLLLTMMGSAGYGHLVFTTAADPALPAPGAAVAALGLFLLTALWHELGHAAALAREGYLPGGIGAGLLFVIPVLYADVTAVGLLSRRGRVRVDLAGVVFQYGVGGVLFAAGRLLPGGGPLVLAGCLALVAAVWSLFPFIRADGYWLVCDLLGVIDLEADCEPPAGRRRRRLLSIYRVSNAVFLVAVGVLVPLRYGHLALTLLDRAGLDVSRPGFRVPLLALAAALLVVVWRNLLRRIRRLLRAAL